MKSERLFPLVKEKISKFSLTVYTLTFVLPNNTCWVCLAVQGATNKSWKLGPTSFLLLIKDISYTAIYLVILEAPWLPPNPMYCSESG